MRRIFSLEYNKNLHKLIIDFHDNKCLQITI